MKTLLESLNGILSEMEAQFGMPSHIRRLSNHARTLGKAARAMGDGNSGAHYVARLNAEKAHTAASHAIVKHLKSSQGFSSPREHEVLTKLRGHHAKASIKHRDAKDAIMHRVSSGGSLADRANFLMHVAPHAPHSTHDTEHRIAARVNGARDQVSPEAWGAHAKGLERKGVEAARKEKDSAEAAHREKTDPAFKAKVDSEFEKQRGEREKGHQATKDKIAADAVAAAGEEPEKGAMAHKRKGRDTSTNKALGVDTGAKAKEMTSQEREAAIQAALDAKKKAKP